MLITVKGMGGREFLVSLDTQLASRDQDGCLCGVQRTMTDSTDLSLPPCITLLIPRTSLCLVGIFTTKWSDWKDPQWGYTGLICHVLLTFLLELTPFVAKFVFLHNNTAIVGKVKPLSALNHLGLKIESGDTLWDIWGLIFWTVRGWKGQSFK